MPLTRAQTTTLINMAVSQIVHSTLSVVGKPARTPCQRTQAGGANAGGAASRPVLEPAAGQIGVERGEITIGHRLVSKPHAVLKLIHLEAAVLQRTAQPVHDLLPIVVRGPHLLPIVHLTHLWLCRVMAYIYRRGARTPAHQPLDRTRPHPQGGDDRSRRHAR